jgi:hypothetical protein
LGSPAIAPDSNAAFVKIFDAWIWVRESSILKEALEIGSESV